MWKNIENPEWNTSGTVSYTHLDVYKRQVEVLPTAGDASAMIEKIEEQQGIRYLKILGRE